MSEYQYVGFRAVDRPVSGANLEYMQKQSSRAKITAWSFDNEYHYGGFRGDAVEMLRRGYDLHLHYANYGTRELLIRLPHGFPDADAAKPYLVDRSLCFLKDKQGVGGTLSIHPDHESGDLDGLWEVGALMDRLVPLRAEIIEGDLRPLYLAHLAVSYDSEHDPEETQEAPTPAGLDKLSEAQQALAEFYDLGGALIAAAARESPPMSAQGNPAEQYSEWLRRQPEATKHEWLARLLADANSTVRADMLAEFRSARGSVSWPTAKPNRTIAQLQAAAQEIAKEAKRKAVAAAARRRAKKLASMAADPAPFLRETEQLVAGHTRKAYGQASDLLAELREALAESSQSGLAEQQAQKLKRENPTLHTLTSELRRQGFVPK